MGQAFSLATPTAGSAGVDVPEMAEFTYQKSMGNAQFMKSIRASHSEATVLIKILVKPYTPMSLAQYTREILRQRNLLADIPNVLTFQCLVETETNGYLIRPFLYSSLYDRLSTRPFLEDIEKKWLAFQLLHALRDSHAKGVFHGDIKAQNVLVTSWNWLYLTDFSSSYKPTMLPEDNPADFSYFFDTSGRRICYVAPERFYPSGPQPPPEGKLGWAMDIFSAGCVIAQLFLETELFTLSQLYKYRRGEYDPTSTVLGSIADQNIRDMIAHMVQLDPEKRFTADKYLESFRGTVFPEYFYTFLHGYMHRITNLSHTATSSSSTRGEGHEKVMRRHLAEPDERINCVWQDINTINSFFDGTAISGNPPVKNESIVSSARASSRLSLSQFPVHLHVANESREITNKASPKHNDGALIFLDLITSSLRNTARSASRLRACDVMLALAERLTDEAKMDRLLPFLVCLFQDECDLVVMAALRSVAQLMASVKTITVINSHIFVDYIIPRIHQALKKSSTSSLVRATYASCIGTLATTAARFLEMAATLHMDGASFTKDDPDVESGLDDEQVAFGEMFDNVQLQLYVIFERHTKLLVEDADVHVRRALLTSVPDLCLFFGPVESNDILLTHLYTYLNDGDWMLKAAFFDTVVSIALLIGATALEEFLLPLFVQAMVDPEEFVVQSAIHALAQLASLGLFSRLKLWELINIVARCTVHPNLWIRQAASEFLSMACRSLSVADVQCLIAPTIEPYLTTYVSPRLGEIELLDLLKGPLPRPVFDQAVSWATHTERGLFWSNSPRAKPQNQTAGIFALKADIPISLSRIQTNDEDEKWIAKLRNLGLTDDDDFKLLALRDFIWRYAQGKARIGDSSGTRTPVSASANKPPLDLLTPTGNGVITLRENGVTPQTVFFDEPSVGDSVVSPTAESALKSPYTIADALMDASMTIEDTQRGKNAASRSGSRARAVTRDDSSVVPRVHKDTSDTASVSSNRQTHPKSSALSLLDRRDINKTPAETGTSPTIVYGQVEGPFVTADVPPAGSSLELANETTGQAVNLSSVNHSYEGSDPNILNMLAKIASQAATSQLADFGPYVPAIAQRRGMAVLGSPGTKWKPGNRLVAMFAEHSAAINRVAVSPDHKFFVTASDDGTAKVWDTLRLERNISQRSRLTHRHADGARIVGLCFLEGSKCFVTCATDGAVHIVRVEVGTAGRYGKLKQVRDYRLPAGEHAVWCDHFKVENKSTLLLATNKCRVLALDIGLMETLYVLQNPVQHGTITCFLLDRRRTWLALGTSHGIVDIWDLRFQMRVKSWGLPGKSCIHRITHHPARGHGKWICIAGGTGLDEVTTWSIETGECREIYRILGSQMRTGIKGYTAIEVDDDCSKDLLGYYAASVEVEGTKDCGIRALAMGTGVSSNGMDIKHAFMLSGGTDRRLRFWDMAVIENSSIYSGSDPGEKVEYSTLHQAGSCVVGVEQTRKITEAPAGAGHKRRGKNTVVSKEQLGLLRGHLDCVLDVAMLEHPFTMSISVDRSGVVHVFQ